MNRSRFTEELRDFEGARSGGEDDGPVPQARHIGGHALQLESQVRRHGCVRGQAAEGLTQIGSNGFKPLRCGA